MTAEHIAVQTLREIVKLEHTNPAVRLAKQAIEQIEQLQSPTTVHNLTAQNLDITDSPGGGL